MEVHRRQAALTRPANDTVLRALLGQPTEYTPVWLMRQAGRYLPEYTATRARAGSFLNLAKSPELAAEVTVQPLERFPLDAAIVFSDILTIPDAMGLGLAFTEGEGPRFERPLRDERAVRSLAVPDPTAELRYVLDAVRASRSAIGDRVPLIGFSGSPFTLACYMVEGAGSSDWRTLKAMLHGRPDLLHHILETNARFWASTQLAVDCGVDYPWLLFQLATGRPVDDVVRYDERRRLRDLVGDIEHWYMSAAGIGLAMYESPGRRQRARAGFWKPLERGTYYEKNRWDDPGPFVLELARVARSIRPLRMLRHLSGRW